MRGNMTLRDEEDDSHRELFLKCDLGFCVYEEYNESMGKSINDDEWSIYRALT